MRRGLSILEVIFAMAILSLLFLFVLGILPTGVRSIKKSEDMAAAAAYSVELIEDARRNMPQAGAQTFRLTLNNTEFVMVREIYRVDAALTDIAVTASWQPNTPPLRYVTRLRGQLPSPSPR